MQFCRKQKKKKQKQKQNKTKQTLNREMFGPRVWAPLMYFLRDEASFIVLYIYYR